jgi:hypothetical protein
MTTVEDVERAKREALERSSTPKTLSAEDIRRGKKSTHEKCGGWGCVACLSALPEGKTCNDCRHVGRCTTMFGQEATDTACQFIPSRWTLKESR